MAKKKTTKKKTGKTTRKKSSSRKSSGNGRSSGASAGSAAKAAEGKHLVIVESPTKARTINRYLGPDYHVMASVGHVRDLPPRPPKGVKREDMPVPGVDLDNDFEPTYEVMSDKTKTVTDLRKAAKNAADVYFATDLDREGEAIAWHLAKALGIDLDSAKRVVFNAITKGEIERAFEHPRTIESNRVDAQQARRILDRIVGYQVSPLLWKKVAGGLSAGRVQSVATRLVVEREREIEAFIPDEFWKITGLFATDPAKAGELAKQWAKWIDTGEDSGGNPRTAKDQNAWLSDHACLRSELVEFEGEPFKPDNRDDALAAAQRLGFILDVAEETEDERGKGPARFLCTYHGHVAESGQGVKGARGQWAEGASEDGSGAVTGPLDPSAPRPLPAFRIRSIQTKRTTSRPAPPFITSTLQQAASNRLSFQLQRTMRIAQQLYEGIDLKGPRGQTGLITYMRTDSTHLSGDALSMARGYIEKDLGDKYLPEKPNFYKSSNKDAQEAHEAIRPTDVSLTPQSIRSRLTEEQFKLYDLIWRRFVACQMVPAQWDSTTIEIEADEQRPRGQGANGPSEDAKKAGTGPLGPTAPRPLALFKASGRTLVFDGFLKVMGIPRSDDVILPELNEDQPVAPIDIDPTQHFTSPPPRYTEASLQKKLEEEGIGRPSTYASIISTIQDRKYVEPVAPRDRRLMATDLGKVVTDKLLEAFPEIMDVGYTRKMEAELDEIEDASKDWRKLLHEFYDPFREKLEEAHESMTHAKAETEPAPYDCPTCGAPTCYRFGKNGRFLSCTRYPDCKYAAPIDREGRPKTPEETDILCPEDGEPMIKRDGRFGPFLASQNYPDVKFILKIDPKKGHVVLPKTDPMLTDIECPKCGEAKLYMRESKRGPWLSCSRFPKCRGRVGWTKLDEDKQAELEKQWEQHVKEHPVPTIRTVDGRILREGDEYVPKIADGDSDDGTSGGYVEDAA